ncbi:hypothetical protein [Bradyrhizobium liaoningense]|uniref:hypothetical protein n=1 Tax=Bradyrhizobium liaoningense TaxID=43992 RepID=UPI0005507B61|nr:hypothetical protein [Bradyrhizobium liaoningense]
MSAEVLYLRRSCLGNEDYDPNLSNRFSPEEIHELWAKVDRLVVDEVRKLVLRHDHSLANDLTPEELGLRVAKIASFFLREGARRIDMAAYIAWDRSRTS